LASLCHFGVIWGIKSQLTKIRGK